MTVFYVSVRMPAFSALGICVAVGGCGLASAKAGQTDIALEGTEVSFVSVSDTMPVDPDVEALIIPYREHFIEKTSRVIGRAIAQFNEAQPEGALGNLVADAMLHVVQALVHDSVHVAVANNGGIRVPILKGPVTVGEIYEVAPFENFLAVVDVSGSELHALAVDIARAGGQPIAGFSFQVNGTNGEVVDVRVGREPVRDDRTYRLVTLDYLLDGGDVMRTLWAPRPRTTTAVLLRDAIVQYIAQLGEIRPKIEGRIVRLER